jgi:LysR family transcriptional regulator, transcription activator of glutamate synthase operon
VELRDLGYFAAIARLGSFRGAASELHVSQPTLSQQIKKLEQELGVKLLARNSHMVRLTEAGQVFLDGVQPALAALRAAQAELAEFRTVAGKLVVGSIAMAQYAFPTFLAGFREQYPNVDLVLRQLPHDQVIPALLAGEIHVGLMQVHSTWHTPAAVSLEHVADIELGAVLHPDDALAARQSVRLRDLKGQRLILPAVGSAARSAVELAMKKAKFEPDMTPFETSASSSVAELVAAGLGVGLTPEPALRGVPHKLEFRRLEGAHMSYHISVVWVGRLATPVVDAFRRSARGWLAGALRASG